MKVTVSGARLSEVQAEALILGIPGNKQPLSGVLAEADQALNGAITTVLKGRTFKGKPGDVETLYPMTGLGASRIVLVGLGEEAVSPEDWRKAVSTALDALVGKAASVALLLPEGVAAAAEGAAEAGILSLYEFHPYISEKDEDEVKVDALTLLTGDAGASDAAERGAAMARAVSWVRDLSNTPGNMLTVPQLVEQAASLEKSHGLTVRVLDYAALQKEGLNLVVAVGKGSEHPPAFVVLEYRGGPADQAPIALVGKGITFDTGGICIKPRAGMEEMKTDMHGAATVMGTLRMAAERKLPVNLVGLLSIAENMPNGNATVPGDVITSYNGLTVEIADTDAEGRLVLADALGYAVKNYKPRAIVDLATLTGSIIVALAYEASGLFTNNQDLAVALKAAGEATGERLWQFPTWDAYDSNTRSDIADLKNAGKEKGDAIHAAVFLKAFVGDIPWAHIDIAGPSFIPEPKPYKPKGSTGVGVRMLIHWLESLS
jgi:leucyl aminopeptidase